MIRALLTLLLNFVNIFRRALRWVVRLARRRRRARERRFVRIKLPPGVQLKGAARKLGPVTIGPAAQGAWWAFDELVREVCGDPEVEGVIFKTDSGPSSLVGTAAVARRLAEVRRSGKRVVAQVEGGMLGQYLAAIAADTIVMAPPGRLYTFAPRIEMTFLADALRRVGIEAQFINLGRFKTAGHRFTRSGRTSSQDLMMRQLLFGMNHHVKARVSKRRGLTVEKADALFHRAPMSARDARRLGFVDHCAYADDLRVTLEGESGCDRKLVTIGASRYLAGSVERLRWKSLRKKKKPKVAVLELKGMILQGNEGRLAQLQGSITPQPVIKALKRLAKDTSVKAVVLRIDSPGGSATASDLIWRQIKKLAQKKPTIASLGRVAGSGGYYIAVAADEIIAHPETITGSIGVIAGKLSGGPLLDKLGIKVESMSEVEDNNLSSLAAPLTEPELTNLRRDIRAFYRRFIRCVAEGRQMSRQRVHRLGRGRVYTGSRALGVGLVDRLGGLQDAIDVACERAGLESRSAEVVFVDHKKTRRGIKTLVGGVSVRDAVVTQLIPGALTQHVLAATMLSRPNTLALMPSF